MENLDKNKNERLAQQIFQTMVRKYRHDKPDENLKWLEDMYFQVDHFLRLPGSTFSREINKLKK